MEELDERPDYGRFSPLPPLITTRNGDEDGEAADTELDEEGGDLILQIECNRDGDDASLDDSVEVAEEGVISDDDLPKDDVEMHLVQSGDPRVRHAIVSGDCTDWARYGEAVGGNANLVSLSLLRSVGETASVEDIGTFFHGVSRNRSIKKLFIGWDDFFGSLLFGGEAFSASLVTFLRGNSSVERLEISCDSVWGIFISIRYHRLC